MRIEPAPRAMPVPTIPAPAADGDDVPLVVRKAASDGKASANNFLASAFALIQ